MARKRRKGKRPDKFNLYFCASCNAPATKPPLKAIPNWKSAEPSEFGGLGSWHCTGGCKGKVKVRRETRKREEQLEKAA